ncbi:hypothetical protein AAVH_21699 [Aphelenchoides avenae]|nr:hypothetical protein AAVH_21699 [Aphelenchus avenae]
MSSSRVIALLQTALETVRSENEESLRHLREAQQKLAQSQTRILELEKETSTLSAENTELEKEKSTLTAENTKLQQQNESVEYLLGQVVDLTERLAAVHAQLAHQQTTHKGAKILSHGYSCSD